MWKTTDLLGKLALLYFRISLNLPFGCTLTTFLDIFFPYTWNAPFSPRFSNVFVYRNGFSVNLPFGVTLTTFLGYIFFFCIHGTDHSVKGFRTFLFTEMFFCVQRLYYLLCFKFQKYDKVNSFTLPYHCKCNIVRIYLRSLFRGHWIPLL